MRALMTVVLALGLLPATESFRDLFCPRCETFTHDGAALDARGRCGTCGRPPVVVEAAERAWWWCALKDAWLDQPCEHAEKAGCCTRFTATAFLEVPGRYAVYTRLYCPACRTSDGFESEWHDRDVCVHCRRPAATAEIALRAWVWCRRDQRWDLKPCLRDAHERCCEKVVVRALVAPDRLPPPDPLARP